jgi:hypothetical protein
VRQFFHPKLELVVKSGFIYLPLLYDPDVNSEMEEAVEHEGLVPEAHSRMPDTVVELNGKTFVKSLKIHSILSSYDAIDKSDYQELVREYLEQRDHWRSLESLYPHGKLLTILFEIMPYFIRKRKRLKGRQRGGEALDREKLLDLIGSRIDIPRVFFERADEYLDAGSLRRRLDALKKLEQALEPLPDGALSGEALRRWLRKALYARLSAREMDELEREFLHRERFGESKRSHVATLLYIAETGSLEIDGFGFTRTGSGDDYLIYKRMESFTLKDYYARSYRFPGCRVAVSTAPPFGPLVLDHYKHPFLFGDAPKQEICLKDYRWPEEFSAEDMIRLLEDGINTLLYGYDPRRRNGYHSLDRTWQHIKTIEFDDYLI